mmetsp:Transcript_12765/g.54028  ORF Transcript_12765/g.54028 Transcript_12765/m.54028 type:complete len:442 (+) Transcript_12765:199-1524(+)
MGQNSFSCARGMCLNQSPNRRSPSFEGSRSLLFIGQFEDDGTAITRLPLERQYPNLTVGTVIRGDELGKLDSNRALVTFYALYNLAKHFGQTQVVVFVDESGFCDEFPRELDRIRCISIQYCSNAQYAAPTMDCVFESLLSRAHTELVGFINGDILTFKSLLESLAVIALNVENFLLVGRRYTTKNVPTVSHPNQLETLETLTETLHPDTGYAVDYFFSRTNIASKVLQDFPAFVVGTYRWDNVLLSLFYKSGGCVVIDATQAAPVLHIPSTPVKPHIARPAAVYNQAIATFCCGDDYIAGSIDYADLILQRASEQHFSLSPQTLQIQVLRCSLRYGILASHVGLPKPVQQWLKNMKSGVPRGVGAEALVIERIRNILLQVPRFRFLLQRTEALFVYYEPTLMNFIFSLSQPAGSSCLARINHKMRFLDYLPSAPDITGRG